MKESVDLVIARDRVIATRVIFQRFAQNLYATLREIFDESAYDRFLLRSGIKHSAESYKIFMRERESTMAKKPRCC